MLKCVSWDFYKVKNGQTIKQIANAFCVSEWKLVKENNLKCEPSAGQILVIPKEKGNVYFAADGDSKTLLCGSEEAYEKQNGTAVFYPGMRVIL